MKLHFYCYNFLNNNNDSDKLPQFNLIDQWCDQMPATCNKNNLNIVNKSILLSFSNLVVLTLYYVTTRNRQTSLQKAIPVDTLSPGVSIFK